MIKLIAQIVTRWDNDHHDINRIAIELIPGESSIPTHSKEASGRFATRLALFYGTLFGLIGTQLPFFPLWLKAIGIESSWIGIIVAAPSVTRFTILPFITGFAERRHLLRSAMVVLAFATALGFSLLGTLQQPLAVFIAFAVTACMWTPMIPLTDAYALKGVARYGLNYGPLRLWGSAAFVVGALASGLLVEVIAANHLIWVIAAVAGLGAATSLGLQQLDSPDEVPTVASQATILLRQPGFLAIIVAAALVQGSHAAYYTFASITWQNAGLSGLTVAGLWVLGVLAEIVVFALSPRFTISPAIMMIIGALMAVVRWLITAQEPPVGVLAVVQLGHGLTYGMTQIGTMGLLIRNVPGPVMARGQGYLAACAGIVTSAASVVSGAVYAQYGQGVYYLMAAMALLGAAVIWPARHRLADQPQSAASGG